MQKDIAKSLHTISALVNVCRFHESLGKPRSLAMKDTMETLGLAGRPDPHGLEEKALRMMDKA